MICITMTWMAWVMAGTTIMTIILITALTRGAVAGGQDTVDMVMGAQNIEFNSFILYFKIIAICLMCALF